MVIFIDDIKPLSSVPTRVPIVIFHAKTVNKVFNVQEVTIQGRCVRMFRVRVRVQSVPE
jgi:hypothetical protein